VVSAHGFLNVLVERLKSRLFQSCHLTPPRGVTSDSCEFMHEVYIFTSLIYRHTERGLSVSRWH